MKSVNVSTHTKEDTISSPGGSFTEAPVTQKEDRANVVYPPPRHRDHKIAIFKVPETIFENRQASRGADPKGSQHRRATTSC